MTIQSVIRKAALGALLPILLAACAAQDVVPHEAPPPPVSSVAQADQQLGAVARERAAIESRFAERERVCYDKFFVNRCLDEAKERRRTALAAQRAIEIQAQHFKRQAVVEERDRQMAEAEKRFEAQQAKMAAEPPKAPPVVKPEPAPRTPTAPKRIAERNARQQAQQKREAADADKRAASVRAYEERKAEAEKRQKRVAERKAERAAEEAKKK